MDNKDLWRKISGSINFNIRDLWKKNLLRSSEEVADEYIESTLVDEDSYSYLDKQTYEYIPISEEDIKELEDKIKLNKRNIKLAKVIEFPLNFKK